MRERKVVGIIAERPKRNGVLNLQVRYDPQTRRRYRGGAAYLPTLIVH